MIVEATCKNIKLVLYPDDNYMVYRNGKNVPFKSAGKIAEMLLKKCKDIQLKRKLKTLEEIPF